MSEPAGGVEAKPNLTPLLDMVLQLVMFFMICANFVMDQLDQKVRLPTAQSAKAMDSKVDDYLLLNVNEEGHVLVGKNDPNPRRTLPAIEQLLRNEAKLAAKDADGNVKKLLIIRAHKDAKFKHVFSVMKAAKSVGFKAVQLRAIKG